VTDQSIYVPVYTHTARSTTALQRLLTHAIVYLHHINNIF